MKLYSYKDSTKAINYFETDKQVEIPDTFNKKEVRGMWVSNVANIDLPIIKELKEYKKEIIRMLETCVEFNINTIYFQVRTTNDAFYKSEINPYSRYLTGKEGKTPQEDILPFVIEEAHKRDIEFHAWCNPYRISVNGELSIKDYLDTCDDLNFAKKHPEFIMLDKSGKLILNPTKKEVQDHIINSMEELAKNYDIDGIHFDDYFYPYSGLQYGMDDLKDYERREQKEFSLGDFRRFHVNNVINGVSKKIKEINPELSFGVSPFGIWKNKYTDELGSNTSPKCSESYYLQYADSRKWVKDEMIDYIVPQIYWEFNHAIAPFADICDWWVDVCKGTKVDLYIGHAAYRFGNEGDFENPEEVSNQLKYANSYETVKGNVFFTYKNFIEEDKKKSMENIKKLLKEV